MIPGILLTGGASSRMGRDKATMEVDGETLANRAASVLQTVCDPVIEVGPGVTALRAVREDPPGSGPLAALFAGAAALGTDGPVLLLACDLPFMTAAVVRTLAEHPHAGSVIPLVSGHEQYACARWSAQAIAHARAGRALRDLMGAEDALLLSVDDEHALADVDTPDDLRRLGLS